MRYYVSILYMRTSRPALRSCTNGAKTSEVILPFSVFFAYWPVSFDVE